MKNLRFILLVTAFFVTAGVYAQRDSVTKEGLVWHTNLIVAHDSSVATGRPIFAFFTGSDWCGWCKKLQREVFAKTAFIDWAKKNVVLLELDFPRRTQLSPELTQQNAYLQQGFQVSGYPTIWLFTMAKDESGKFNITPMGSCGYPSGAEPGKEEVKFLSNVTDILQRAVVK